MTDNFRGVLYIYFHTGLNERMLLDIHKMVSARSSCADSRGSNKKKETDPFTSALFNVLFAMKRAWMLKITDMLCFVFNLMVILGLKP